jgi:NAD(P)-dependent dehydrogenase (short-subunit alcohol dehydrogenase family)
MRITDKHLLAFERLSHDHNPLHTDPVYAHSTQFGRPVVYGMSGVLLGLAHWARGQSFRINQIRGQFGKPLFANEEYDLRITESANQVKVQYLKGPIVQSTFAFTWEDYPQDQQEAEKTETHSFFHPLSVAKVAELPAALELWQNQSYPYSIDLDAISEALPDLGLQLGQIPLDQLNALSGSSYFVGMELPGRQALFSSFEFQFAPFSSQVVADGFKFHGLALKKDERLQRITISGRGTGIGYFSLVAFQRPKRVRYDIRDIEAAIGQSDLLKDKVVLISGATRGFGAVLAKALALQDANLILNYRSNRGEAEAVAGEIRPWNAKVSLVPGDVSKLIDCRGMRSEIENRFGKIDLLVSNAFPPITAKYFLEQDSQEFLRVCEQSISTNVTLLHELLPLVSAGGTIVQISTVFTQIPKPQYSHYIAAKFALEGLVRALAVEFRDQKFLIIRPPRMLTDQTNLPFDLSPPISAIEVGRRLLDILSRDHGSGNLVEIDLA